jgi:hypothetical protein
MSEAFASDVASAPAPLTGTTPTTDAPAASASADTTVPPADGTTPDNASTAEPTGPIPLDRHKAILDGRTKERDEARQQLEGWKNYEWAKQVDRQAVERAVQLGQAFERDRAGYIASVIAEATSDPQLAPVVRSLIARELATRRPAPDLLKPDIPVYDEQGTLVSQTYSAERVQQLVQHAVAQAIAQHVQPLQQDAESRRQSAMMAEQQRQQQAFVTAESARIRSSVEKLPHAVEHWAAIVAKAREYPDEIPVGEALRDAYFDVVGPRLTQAAKADVLDTLKTKAAASSVNPTGAVVAATKRPRSLLDPTLTW